MYAVHSIVGPHSTVRQSVTHPLSLGRYKMYVSDVVLCLTLSGKLKIHIIRAYIVPLRRPHCSNTLTALVYTSQRTDKPYTAYGSTYVCMYV